MSTSDTETFAVLHDPRTLYQVETCEDPGDHHARHRRFTGLVNYVCNCGYSSGWALKATLPEASDFIKAHMPPDAEWPGA
jgi:hypothetical protein